MTIRLALVSLCVIGALGSVARAEPEVVFRVNTPANGPHTLEATIAAGFRVPSRSISVRAADDSGAPVIQATRVRGFAAGDEPIAIAIVFNAQEIFVGNDDIETDPPARYPGVLKAIEPALDALHLAKLGPPGSQIAVVSYATGAVVNVPLEPLDHFKGAQLGTQRDYRNRIGTDMVLGISAGLTELGKSEAIHKLLIVIGDGNDTNNDDARSALSELKRQARGAGIQMFATIYKSPVSADTDTIRTIIPDAVTVTARDGIVLAIAARLQRITSRSFVTFADDRLPWDGREHELVVRIGDVELPSEIVVMPDFRVHTPWWRGRWAQLVAGLVLLGTLIATLRIRARREP